MMVEDYVSFETAKLLKEKGFDDEYTNAFFDKTGNLYFIDLLSDLSQHTDNDTDVAASTLYVAMKWLREEKKLNCIIDVSFNQDRNGETEYRFYVWENKPPYELLREHTQTFSIYEEACEAAIKYCLENLI